MDPSQVEQLEERCRQLEEQVKELEEFRQKYYDTSHELYEEQQAHQYEQKANEAITNKAVQRNSIYALIIGVMGTLVLYSRPTWNFSIGADVYAVIEFIGALVCCAIVSGLLWGLFSWINEEELTKPKSRPPRIWLIIYLAVCCVAVIFWK